MTRTDLHLLVLALFPLAAAPACSDGGSVDLGHNVGSQLSDYAASWDGYTEAYSFYDGSDRVRITLDASGQGTLVAGTQAAPPPLMPDDPSFTAMDALVTGVVVPGLPYLIEGAHVQEQRIQLSINLKEQFRQWCSAQAPICDGQSCGCLPSPTYPSVSCFQGGTCTAPNPTTGQTDTFSQTRFVLCGTCSCTAAGCSIGEATTLLDAALENGGTQLVGTLLINERVTVRMTRD